MDPSKPESFNHRTEKLATGRTYHFIDQLPEQYDSERSTTLLLLHGFPDLWYGWRYQIKPWVKAGYRVVAPDMLGCGDTDKPTEESEYSTKKICTDLASLLDLLAVEKTVLIGHDWGSFTAGRFALWYPDRLLALIQLGIPFNSPLPIDLGLEQYVQFIPNQGYRIYLNDPSAVEEIEANIETLFKLFFSKTAIYFTKAGALQPLLLGKFFSKRDIPLLLTEEEMSYMLSQYKSAHGALSYFRNQSSCFEDEKNGGHIGRRLELPVLFINGINDPTFASWALQRMPEDVLDLTTAEIDAGHWLMLEAKDLLVEKVLIWLERLKTESVSSSKT